MTFCMWWWNKKATNSIDTVCLLVNDGQRHVCILYKFDGYKWCNCPTAIQSNNPLHVAVHPSKTLCMYIMSTLYTIHIHRTHPKLEKKKLELKLKQSREFTTLNHWVASYDEIQSICWITAKFWMSKWRWNLLLRSLFLCTNLMFISRKYTNKTTNK